jgi:hypothetical protein
MGALLRVKVPSQADHSERSDAQLHAADRLWEGSVARKLRADEQESDVSFHILIFDGDRPLCRNVLAETLLWALNPNSGSWS